MKPFTAKHMFGSSPLKKTDPPKKTTTTKPNPKTDEKKYVDSKNADVRKTQVSLDEKAQKGYTKKESDNARKIVSQGEGKSMGAKTNYKTGESSITPYEYTYVKGEKGAKSKIVNNKTKQVVKEAVSGGNENNTYGGSFKNKKEVLSEKQLRQSYVKDSLNTQGSKEKNVKILKDYKRR